ncbi:hypothetical protein BDW71DRAFT_30550 [Aspergillus fruticulosus]
MRYAQRVDTSSCRAVMSQSYDLHDKTLNSTSYQDKTQGLVLRTITWQDLESSSELSTHSSQRRHSLWILSWIFDYLMSRLTKITMRNPGAENRPWLIPQTTGLGSRLNEKRKNPEDYYSTGFSTLLAVGTRNSRVSDSRISKNGESIATISMDSTPVPWADCKTVICQWTQQALDGTVRFVYCGHFHEAFEIIQRKA